MVAYGQETSMVMRIAAGLMGIVFVGFTAVQFNDPDWYLWVAVYSAAAILSFAAAAGKGWTWASGLLCAISFAWSMTQIHQVPRVTVAELFGDFAMKTQPIEEARESLGLLIVSVWSAVLLAARRRRA